MRIKAVIVAIVLLLPACGGEAAPAPFSTNASPSPAAASPAPSAAATSQSPVTTAAAPAGATAPVTADAPSPATAATPSAVPPAPTTTRVRPDGEDAPDFTLSLGQGGSFTLSEERKPVYMVFWASW